MDPGIKYKRVMLKLSGEALRGQQSYGIESDSLRSISVRITEAVEAGVEVAVVVGGGNIWRGADAENYSMDRATADYIGMLATVMNSLALQDSLESLGTLTRTQSSISIQAVAEPYIRRRAIRHLEKGRVVIFGGGTGSPHVTTDTAAALKAVELNADLLLMSKHGVDGVYDSDPNQNKDAKKFEAITYMDALSKRLQVMDATAISLCMNNQLPIVVFDLLKEGNLMSILKGKKIGTEIIE